MPEPKERASELEWTRWFTRNADFGPAESDIRDNMKLIFMQQTGKLMPVGYNVYSDGETTTDKGAASWMV